MGIARLLRKNMENQESHRILCFLEKYPPSLSLEEVRVEEDLTSLLHPAVWQLDKQEDLPENDCFIWWKFLIL